ncbi:aspartic proteinase-like protein 1 isoform X2 [Arachis hypogaea]
MFFGDQGSSIQQQSTSFLSFDEIYSTCIIGVETCFIGNSCLKMTSFKAQVDSGTLFTFLPGHVYESIAEEFDKKLNASRATFKDTPWEYCYAFQKTTAFCLAIEPAKGNMGTIGSSS